MNYFTIQRILTFLAGIALLYLSGLNYMSKKPLIHYGVALFLAMIGLVVIVAALVPHKRTTKEVAELVLEIIVHLFADLIPNLLLKMVRFIAHLISH